MSCPIYYGLYKISAIALCYPTIKSTVFGNGHQHKGVLFSGKQHQQKRIINSFLCSRYFGRDKFRKLMLKISIREGIFCHVCLKCIVFLRRCSSLILFFVLTAWGWGQEGGRKEKHYCCNHFLIIILLFHHPAIYLHFSHGNR